MWSFCFAQPESISKDSIKHEINYINELDSLTGKRYKIQNESYIVYYKNETIYRVKQDSKRLRVNKNNPIQGESVLELYFVNGKLTFGIVRCESELDHTTAIYTPPFLETIYYVFNKLSYSNISEIIGINPNPPKCVCSDENKIKVKNVKKLIKKLKKQMAKKT
jgi:hypothetical protein